VNEDGLLSAKSGFAFFSEYALEKFMSNRVVNKLGSFSLSNKFSFLAFGLGGGAAYSIISPLG
jgi:hypothetical protein